MPPIPQSIDDEFNDVPATTFHDIVNAEEIMMWFDFFWLVVVDLCV